MNHDARKQASAEREVMKQIILVLVMLCSPAITRGQGVLTNTYKNACQHTVNNDTDMLSRGLCAGYTSGWMDGINGMEITLKGQAYTVIFADKVNAAQVILVAMKYIEQHPESLNKPIAGTFIDALMPAKLIGLKPIERELVRSAQ